MTFRSPRPRNVRWQPVGGEGLEHLTILPGDHEILARGVVIGERDGAPYGVDYTIVCDLDWTVRELDLATTQGMALSLRTDGLGHWINHDGRPLPEFDGCLDVDLAGTPFTHTLPIRRIDWVRQRGPAELGVVYVPFDSFVPIAERRRYQHLEGSRLFGYQALGRDNRADLAVDRDGFVIDHPGLFRRLEGF